MENRPLPFRLAALDIDGTLTTSEKKLTARTKECLLRLQAQGLRLALASGRPTYGVEPIARELCLAENEGFILSYNGGKITECKTGKALFRRKLAQEAIPLLAALREELGLAILTYEGTCIVTQDPEDIYVQKEAAANHMEIRLINSFADYVTFPVTKCLMVGDPSRIEAAEPYAAARLGKNFGVYRSDPYFLEIVPQGIDKANSLSYLLKLLHMESKDLIALGDGYNDINMLRFSGLGVAMGNAGREAKEAADRVAPSNDEDGVAAILEEIFL